MAKKKKPEPPRRQAQLVADAVAVCCPYCGEPQPDSIDGSEQWTKESFKRFEAKNPSNRRDCCSCDMPMFIFNGTRAQFLK